MPTPSPPPTASRREVIALIDDGFISQADALDILRGTSEAARYLVAVAVADPDALPAAALRFATLVDTTTPTFMISGNMMTAQQAVTAINVGISLGGLSGASAVVMLTAMAFVPGGEVSSRNAMNAAADGVRGLLAGTIGGSDAAAAVVAALGPLGFTAEQGVTFLVALGASGSQQIFGSSVIWVNNADLAAAASAAIANLIHDHDLSAEAIGDALSAAFPLGVDSGELAVSTLIKAAPALAALEPDAYTIIGAALAQADAVSAGLAMGQVNDRVRGHEIDAEAGIAIVAGFAGAGTVEDQVAAGRELNAIVYWIGLVAADAIAEIDAAVVAGALTRGEAIVLLAGAATNSSPQGLANLLSQIATYVDADAAAGVAALSAAVTAGALTGTQGLFVLGRWPPLVRPIPRVPPRPRCCPGWMTAPSRPAMRRRSSWPWPTARWRCGRSQAPTSRRWSRMARSTRRRRSRSSTRPCRRRWMPTSPSSCWPTCPQPATRRFSRRCWTRSMR